MTETTAPNAEIPRTSTAARIGWAILILATLYVCYFSHLGAIGFVGPDEPRYAWIARDMAETGDWVTPRLYGKPWFEKPPLFYWGAALSFKLFGVSEAAARLPSAISALLATLALAWLALRLYGAETARWLLLLLPTTVGMIGFSHAAATDMPFSSMLTIAMVCAAVALGLTRNENTPILPRTPWLALLLFGFFLGLAVLAKGPAAIILSGGAIFFWALFTKRWRDAFRLLHPIALASFCLTALPWYILCARRNPDFFRIFIIEHNFKRYLTPEFQHIQPFWFYAPVFLIYIFPYFLWIVRTPIRRHVVREPQARSVENWFLFAWASFPILFFTLSKSKLPGYILPSLFPTGLLIAINAVHWIREYVRTTRWLITATGALFLFLTGLMLLGLWNWRIGAHILVTGKGVTGVFMWPEFVVTAGLGGLMIVGCGLFKRIRLASFLVAGLSLALLLLIYRWLPSLDMELSPRIAATEVLAVTNHNIYSFNLKRGWHYGLDFYLRREVPEWFPPADAEAVVVTRREELKQLKAMARVSKVLSDFSDEAYVVKIEPLVSRSPGRRQPH